MKPSASELTGKLRRLSARIWDPKNAREKAHRLSASIAGSEEEEWDPDQPQIRMSRAFAVMLILHLVAVGGLFAFHIFGKDDQNAEQLATRQAHANATPPPAPRAIPVGDAPHSTAPAPVVPPGSVAPRAEAVGEETLVDKNGTPYQTHTMMAGETKMLVAAKFGTTVKELEEANPGIELKPGAHLTIPQHQRVIGATPESENGGKPPLAILAATGTEDPGAREFAMKDGPENPYQGYDHEAAAAAEGLPAPRATPVSAKPSVGSPGKTTEKQTAKTSGKSTPKAVKADDEDEDRPAKAKPAPQTVTAKPKPATPSGAAGSRTHVVQKGDTVYNVAHRYGLSPNEVMRANSISDPSKLQLGQVLKIAVRR